MAEEEELGWFSRQARDWTEAVGTFFGITVGEYVSSIGGLISGWWERNMEQPANESLYQWVNTMESNGLSKGIADELREMIDDVPAPLDTFAMAFMQFSLLSLTFKDWFGAVSNLNQQTINADVRPNLIGLDVLGRYLVQHPEDYTEVTAIFDRWGIPEDQRTMYLKALRQFPSLTELLTLVNRGLVRDTDAAQTLTRQGMTSDDAWDVLELRKFWPSPTDIVSLAGREAFEEDAIRAFDLDRDMPDEMFDAARKAGVSDEVMRWYWVAHWQNPSLSQVFEMLHRDVKKPDGSTFDQSDLDVFYRLADVNPYFGDLLRQIAYRPYTRVDTRRMFEMGVLSRDEVKRSYLDQGYDDEHAENMTEFTARFVEDKQRDLTKPQIDQLFRLGLIDREEYRDYMEVLGYDEEEAYWLLDLLQAELEEKRLRSALRSLEYQFKRGMLDKIQTEQALSKLDLKGSRINEMVEDWSSEEITEQALPSKEDLIGWYTEGQLSEIEFRRKMRRRRYADDDIDLYVSTAGARPSRTDVLRWFRKGEISPSEATEQLTALGYNARDVQRYLRGATAPAGAV
jgi:hypothetical protein